MEGASCLNVRLTAAKSLAIFQSLWKVSRGQVGGIGGIQDFSKLFFLLTGTPARVCLILLTANYEKLGFWNESEKEKIVIMYIHLVWE